MSFFGFDTNLPRDKRARGDKGIFEQNDAFGGLQQSRKLQAFHQTNDDDILDFDDTYDGLGDQLEEAGDDLNDDTFGAGAEGAGARGATRETGANEFDFFGSTAQVSQAIDEEGMRYDLNPVNPVTSKYTSAGQTSKPARSGYEVYQDPDYIPDIQAKSGFWGSKAQPEVPQQPQQPSHGDGRISTARSEVPGRNKMMSLEEVEAAMRSHPQPPPHLLQQQQHIHPMQGPPPGFPPQMPPMHHSMQPMPPMQPFPQQQPPPQHQQRQPLPPQAMPPPSQQQQQQQQQQHPSRVPPQPQQQPQPPLQILQNPDRPRHAQQPSLGQPGPVITHPEQLMQLSDDQRRAYLEEDAKRAKRNHKIFMLSRGNGLMTPQDKNFITRIQLQQLVAATGNSADPDPEAVLTEDFYYQVYSQIRGAPRQHPGQPLGHFAQTYLFQTGGRMNNRRQNINGENHMQRMQQQVQRAVEAAKLKPKNKQLTIEGSLGKISFSNAKTPKPLLNIRRHDSAADVRPATGRKAVGSDRKSVLRNIEAVYSDLLAMEDHERKMPPPPVEDSTTEEITAHAEWRDEITRLNQQLFSDLKVLDPIIPGSSVIHPFLAFLSFSKGKKAMTRVFRQIEEQQKATILTMIVVHLDQLDVIRMARHAPGEMPPAHIREEIAVFNNTVEPALMSYIQDAPINIMIGLLQLLIEHTNVVNVSCTRVGLSIITLLLSRAVISKENGEVSDDEWQQWIEHYNRLFNIIEGSLSFIFPGPVNSGDDMYVWQFLAAMGISASPEQQQRLVMGLKDRVLDTVNQSKALPPDMRGARLANVNLFMRAIGLDVDMLA